MGPEIPNMPLFPHFGAALRFYREHIAERLTPYVPGIQISAKDVVSSMKRAGYPISQAAYSDIEQGLYLPKDPEHFMEKVIPCLAVQMDSPEYHNLMDHLVYDVLKQRVGETAAKEYWFAIRSTRQRENPPAKSM